VFVAIHCLSVGLAGSFVIQPRVWEYKTRYDIGYEVARATVSQSPAARLSNQTTLNAEMSGDIMMSKNNGNTAIMATTGTGTNVQDINEQVRSTPILLLNGFGVGSFHQHRLISRLLGENEKGEKGSRHDQRSIYCMDYLGQGRSWPKDCQDGLSKSEQGLQYSAETWVDQTITFIEQVILPEQGDNCHKVHLVGNSVGGHLAAYIAARRPDMIESICLLNPTPVWGLNLPGWNGELPAPFLPKRVGRFLFDRIRDLKTIEKFLEQTYSRREAFTDDLVSCGSNIYSLFIACAFAACIPFSNCSFFIRCIKYAVVQWEMEATLPLLRSCGPLL
jgi:pimeloyl-ACP methyl ester carboxylesterase